MLEGVKKGNALVAGAHAGLAINQAHAVALQLPQRFRQIRDGERQMMDSLAAFGDKTRDGGIPLCALQQFQAAIAQAENCHAHLLVGNALFRIGSFPHQFLKDGDGLRK